MLLRNILAVQICNRNTPDPCQQPERKYCSLIDLKLAMETHRISQMNMFKARPVIEGHHEIRKSFKSLAPLEEMSSCHLSFLESKAPSVLKVKMGCGTTKFPSMLCNSGRLVGCAWSCGSLKASFRQRVLAAG